MKVEFQIKNDTLIAVDKQLDKIYTLPVSQVKTENVYKSIGYDLADKINTKAKTLIKRANLFDKKKTKLTLKYHEAWALEQILSELIAYEANDYHRALLQAFINQINQKLA